MRSPEQTIVDPAETDGPRVLAMGDAAVLVELADLDAVLAHAAAIEAAGWPGVVDVVPGARTVVVTVRPGTDLGALRRDIQTLDVAPIDAADGETVEIPVVYDGPDLAEVAELTGLDADEVVAAHTGTPWRVGFGGFAPGFAYLTGGDPRLNVERRSEPRTSVPPGAVGLAGEFSGIYPRSSPGGWQLIGRTDAPLWDATRTPPALLTPGAQVRFVAQERDGDAGAVPPEPEATRVAPDDADATSASTDSQAGPPGGDASAEGGGAPAAMAERAAAAVGLAVVPRRALEVVEVGPLALVQDLGRPGHAAVGVPRSGAADRAALRLANRLVANDDEGAAAIEVLLGGLAVRAHGLRTVALAGAPAPATVDGTPVAHHSVVTLRPGQTLALGPPPTGLRTYLAVRGGLAVDDVLGSVAGDTLSGLGPAPLQPGDVLAVGPEPEHPWLLDLAPVAPPTGGTVTLRAIPGPRADWVADPTALTRTTWTVSSRSDRVGMRLEGEPLRRTDKRELPSEGMVRGAIQVPPGGEPVVFLADHPVTGGYPVVAVVVDADVDRAAQVRPGQSVRFRTVEAP
jgi:KipI family sensor histidine kinase inhibitor